MKLFDWLRKKREDRLPYKIIDVTPEELLAYVGKGRYPVLCQQKDKQRTIDHLLTAKGAFMESECDVMRKTHMIIIWGSLIGGWRRDWCMRSEDTSVWLRVVEPRYANVDDLI